MLTAIAVMLYILSILPPIIVGGFSTLHHLAGILPMIIMVAVATGLLVYNSMTKPKFPKDSDTLVEEFREWQADTQADKQMRGAISSALWTLIVVAYFIVSFTLGAWHISWLIFVAGGFIESFINIMYALKKKGR